MNGGAWNPLLAPSAAYATVYVRRAGKFRAQDGRNRGIARRRPVFHTLLGRRRWIGCVCCSRSPRDAPCTWDEMTSKEFKVAQLLTSTPPTPMTGARDVVRRLRPGQGVHPAGRGQERSESARKADADAAAGRPRRSRSARPDGRDPHAGPLRRSAGPEDPGRRLLQRSAEGHRRIQGPHPPAGSHRTREHQPERGTGDLRQGRQAAGRRAHRQRPARSHGDPRRTARRRPRSRQVQLARFDRHAGRPARQGEGRRHQAVRRRVAQEHHEEGHPGRRQAVARLLRHRQGAAADEQQHARRLLAVRRESDPGDRQLGPTEHSGSRRQHVDADADLRTDDVAELSHVAARKSRLRRLRTSTRCRNSRQGRSTGPPPLYGSPTPTPNATPVYGNSTPPNYGATPPAGTYRNANGELVVPVNGTPSPSR